MRAVRYWRGLAFVLFFSTIGTLAASLPGSQSANQNSTDRVLGTAQSDQEFEAYQLALKSHVPQESARSAEAFLKQYPNSGLAPYVHKVAVIAYQQLNNPQKVILHGEAMLKDLPDNAAVLAILARAYVETDQPTRAIARGTAALRLLGAMPGPPSITPAEWLSRRNTVEADIRLSLGSAYLTMALEEDRPRQRNESLRNSVAALQGSLDAEPQLGTASYRLALAYLATNDREAAAKYFAWTAVVSGDLSKAALSKLEEVCRAQGKAPHPTIDNLLAEARSDLHKKLHP